jgi:hypothetical protein
MNNTLKAHLLALSTFVGIILSVVLFVLFPWLMGILFGGAFFVVAYLALVEEFKFW